MAHNFRRNIGNQFAHTVNIRSNRCPRAPENTAPSRQVEQTVCVYPVEQEFVELYQTLRTAMQARARAR